MTGRPETILSFVQRLNAAFGRGVAPAGRTTFRGLRARADEIRSEREVRDWNAEVDRKRAEKRQAKFDRKPRG